MFIAHTESVVHTQSVVHRQSVVHTQSVVDTQCPSVEHTHRGGGRAAGDFANILEPHPAHQPPTHTHTPDIATPQLRGDNRAPRALGALKGE